MMNIFFKCLLCSVSTIAQPPAPAVKHPGDKNEKISVQLRLSANELKDSGKVTFRSATFILSPVISAEWKRPKNGAVQIEKITEELIYVNFIDLLRTKKDGSYLAEPGDEVVITSTGNGFYFSGKDAEKYRFQYQLDSLDKSIPKANQKTGPAIFRLDSLEEYFAWTDHYRQKINQALPLLNRYKGKMSEQAYGIIADRYIRSAIKNIRDHFYSLMTNGVAGNKILRQSLISIYDTSYSKYTQQWLALAMNKPLMALELKTHQLQRTFSFDSSRMPAADEMMLQQLEEIMKTHKGQELESLVVNRLPQMMIKSGFTPAIERLLGDYYAKPGYPEWKKWMREKELTTRLNKLSGKAPDFTIRDTGGKLVTNKDLRGKIAVLYFKSPLDAKNKTGNSLLQNARVKFKNHPGVTLVSISPDPSVIKKYALTSFPWVWVMDSAGRVINANPRIDLTQDNGEMLAAFIQQKIDDDKAMHQKMMSYKKDGPYVFHESGGSISYSIDDTHIVRIAFDKSARQHLSVQTDLDKKFTVRLQPSLAIQPAVFPAAGKLLVFSDIEGNFDALRKLLQTNKVIDENFSWAFGNGHLVFAGDMFDRGMQVTECLWLLYALEEKAKAVGGYVHFVLGNHEIMNMQGYHHYVTPKYKTNAALMGKTLIELYHENSELGRWLRTKNIIEKIGDLLFVHGGISPEVNRLSLGIKEINDLARPYYGRSVDSTDKVLLTIYDSRFGERYRISPFWSRGYYKAGPKNGVNKISNEELDSTLHKFDVRRIITGHTIVADTISVHYGGRVINTDTHHAGGKSEALLIEGDRYYRVNDRGDKILLFIDDKLKTDR